MTRDERHQRSAEYIEILRREWSGEKFDHDGRFYQLRGARSDVVPTSTIPVFFGGRSEHALQTAAAHADIYAFGVETLGNAKALIEDLRARAAGSGRTLRFCMSARIILGESEQKAWANADAILKDVVRATAAVDGRVGTLGRSDHAEAMAAQGDILDERLWMGITKATLFQKAANSFVGTPDSVADALLRYFDLGVTSFLISDFDPLPDVETLGRQLIPMLRAKALARSVAPRTSSSA